MRPRPLTEVHGCNDLKLSGSRWPGDVSQQLFSARRKIRRNPYEFHSPQNLAHRRAWRMA